VAQIPPRVLVILTEKHHAAWLWETENGNLKESLVPYPADQMRTREISPRVTARRMMIHRSGSPLMAEIGHLKREDDVKLVCLKRENKLKGPF
jgi:putative SOS response-associated peptidase YedK